MIQQRQALKQVLQAHGISQNQLAVAMNIAPANVSRWLNEVRDPTGDVIVKIKNALEKIYPAVAEDFVMVYWYDFDGDEN